MIGFGIAAIIAAFLLFQAAFNSWRLALVATVALPLSLTGGLLTGLIGGRTFGLGALLGMLALLGLAARYIALMLTTIQGPDGRREATTMLATVHGRAGESFGSLIISAAALAAVALPFVVLGPRPGLEILHPLALVLLGGLVSTSWSPCSCCHRRTYTWFRSRPRTSRHHMRKNPRQCAVGAAF